MFFPGLLTFLLLLFATCEAGIFGKWYKLAIKAKIKCNEKKFDNVTLQLFKSEDAAEVLIPTSITKKNGKTEITAEIKEQSKFQPVLHLLHRCNEVKDPAKINVCPMDFWIQIPKKFVFEDTENAKPYSITIDLDKKEKFDGMKRNCDVMF
ncbi:unnamed protein product [Bursaphelenchus xylophilus]|uniref:(pine wood nematode) hypothetical protein n=1 Tax=Bursaphelenchus xylophilus TaxID=6326 RepID=A0A1I7SC56_BURXY|nr:unnamed protein product [Bursaphelenchus xylophilus]CAG9094700.1 unnamed protein product [Bursaphelenchus xylophilus]